MIIASSAGGGLLLWQQADDPEPEKGPAARIPAGECRGTLDDPRFSDLLQSASPPSVRTESAPLIRTAPASLSCVVTGSNQRSLVATLQGAATEAERTRNEGQQVPRDFVAFPDGEAGDRFSVVRFSCVTKLTPDSPDHIWYYTAALSLQSPDGPAVPAPGPQRMTDLTVALARQAAGKALACTNTLQLPNGPYTFR
ncbi:hypothetical protein ACIGXI_23450 [Kitasatospora aureofaciens]|uniref:hypothetical protein n=1 Tax=Kitasatospora aureofaciens TaxID=1894 RepID=UPI0037C9AAFD